jgi:hypothetical protein
LFVSGDRQTFKSFDCNWSGPGVARVEAHVYDGAGAVLGWLHPRGVVVG